MGIETDEELKGVLHELADGQHKEYLFIGGCRGVGDERLYEKLVRAEVAGSIESRVRRYQEILKWLLSVEERCKVRLKTEYLQKLEGCVGFLQRELGKIYVKVIERRGREGNVWRWLEELIQLSIIIFHHL